jgi:hypothetical protein
LVLNRIHNTILELDARYKMEILLITDMSSPISCFQRYRKKAIQRGDRM